MALAKRRADAGTLYDRDFYRWLNEQAAALRGGELTALDAANLAEEIEDMGRSQRAAVKSQLARLMAHLLKWSVRGELRRKNQRTANSWRGTIAAARHEISEVVEDSPSLTGYIKTIFPRAYVLGIKWAMQKTGLAEKAFPEMCPWTLEEVLTEDFYHESSDRSGR